MFRRLSAVPAGASAIASSSSLVTSSRSWSYVPKSDLWLDKVDMAREMNESTIRSGKVPDYNVERFRNMFWRYDESIRRAEKKVQDQGFFFFPILDYEIHKGVMPLFSSTQMRMHMKHHKAYIAKLNQLIQGTRFEGVTLDEIIIQTESDSAHKAIYNNAAQHYNHMFFWKSIHAFGSVIPPDLKSKLTSQYGSVEEFQKAVTTAGMNFFGSGWLWVVYDETVGFDIITLSNAGCGLSHRVGVTPVLAVDLWEHTWYMDYENEKAKYLDNFWQVIDWHWMERHWKKATKQEYEPIKFL